MQRRDFLKSFFATAAIASIVPTEVFSKDDVYLSKEDFATMKSVLARFDRLKERSGYGKFNIISFDDALFIARNYPEVGGFTKKELTLIEKMFYENPSKYGFYGKRTCNSLTQDINEKDVIKMPYTGHYLFRGKSEKTYHQVLKDVGSSLTLTSGVRSVVKQMDLYFSKIVFCNGNVSQACYSLAPAGYSYHSISDFDVGKKGWGSRNFTASFAMTPEFRELTKLNYVDIRYKIHNPYGVRFEPWHITVS